LVSKGEGYMNFQFIKQWATIGCFSLAVISGLTHHTQAQQKGKCSEKFSKSWGMYLFLFGL